MEAHAKLTDRNPAIVTTSPGGSEISAFDRRARIIFLARSALNGADAVRRQQRKCVEEAVECGRLLIEEKLYSAPKGKWADYLKVHFGGTIPERTARMWMNLAKRAEDHVPQQNLERHGILALELMPAKERPVQSHNVAVALRNNHMASVMRVESWIKHFKAEERSKASPAYLRRLSEDFRHVSEFIAWLHAEVRATSKL